jgi:hypothetical protein
MSDLHILDKSRRGSAVLVYIERCELLLERAFLRSFDERQAFGAWLRPQMDRADDQVLALLHEDPLYTVARYLGIPKLEIHPEILVRATDLARKHHW